MEVDKIEFIEQESAEATKYWNMEKSMQPTNTLDFNKIIKNSIIQDIPKEKIPRQKKQKKEKKRKKLC